MGYLNEEQCKKLDAILKSFSEDIYLDTKEVLSIEPIERKANALINILTDRGFVNRIGETEENVLPMMISIEPLADIFLDNGGFYGELTRRIENAGSHTNVTIHSTGHGNMINTGNNNNIQSHHSISSGNIEEFKNGLRANKVAESDIAEISEIVQIETPDGSQLGPGVKGWIQKMIGKSIDSTWEIGISAAGGILAEIINKYYGI